MKKIRKILALIAITVAAQPGIFYAEDVISEAPVDIKRTIVALYDSTDPFLNRTDYNLIHQSAEMPLNYLGLKVVYHDLDKGLPGKTLMEEARGIITWFKDVSLKDSAGYCKWLSKEIRDGKKTVIMGGLGAYKDRMTGKETDMGSINKIFRAMGLEYKGNWTDDPFLISVSKNDPRMTEFERTLDNEITNYEQVTSLSEENHVYLELAREDIPDSGSAAVVVTPCGGFALNGYDIFLEENGQRKQWRVNPFRFFAEAYALEGIPCYDTTTLFGNRILYIHIDGDGVRNVSFIDNKTLSSEMVKKEILEKYDLPVTASFITCEIDKDYLGDDETLRISKEILSLPNVEPGVHGFSHPLDWVKKLTAFSIEGYSVRTDKEVDDKTVESAYGDSAKVIVPDEDYLRTEISDAVEYINDNIAPAEKKVSVYQWTGDCKPTEKAIEETVKRGVKNINGGDSRFDGYYLSYNGVAPLVRQVGSAVQMYTSNANENIYTHEWTGPFDGFQNVIQTFKNTEYPPIEGRSARRVSPMNIYYHYYIGERPESLMSLKKVYEYALSVEENLIPVFTSQYIAVVKGFLSGKIAKTFDGGWRFYDYGSCRTVRIDDKGLYPDLERSRGVLGFKKWEGYLYIHLADTGRALLYMTPVLPKQVFIKGSSVILKNVYISAESITFDAGLTRDSSVIIANVPENTGYIVTVVRKDSGEIIYKKAAYPDNNGDMPVVLTARGSVRVKINNSK